MMCSLGWFLFFLTLGTEVYLAAKLWKHRAQIREWLRGR